MSEYKVEPVRGANGIQFAVVHNGEFKAVRPRKDEAETLKDKFNRIRAKRLANGTR